MSASLNIKTNDTVYFQGVREPITAVATALHPVQKVVQSTVTTPTKTIVMTPANSVVSSVDTLGRQHWVYTN